jgi:RNA polymerase sigma-70 factor (sigma-E family)
MSRVHTASFREAVAKPGEQKLADLYWRHASEAVRLAFLLTGDQHAAEDIVQDAFVRLFGHFQDLRNPDAFEVYLRRTVVNLSRDRFRSLRLERDYVAQVGDPSSREVVSPQIEERELIRDALRSLPHRQRAALVLRFYADLSEQQTAEVLQCSVAAVKSLVSRATTSLRKRMRGEFQ